MTRDRTDDSTDDAGERIEERVRQVRHLDPFNLSVRDDGRFTCELTTPPSRLSPGEARRALEAIEAALDPLRRRAGKG